MLFSRRLGKVWDLLGVSHPMAHLDHPVSRDLIYNISVRGTEDFKDLETPLTSMVSYFFRIERISTQFRKIVSYGSVLLISHTVRVVIESLQCS